MRETFFLKKKMVIPRHSLFAMGLKIRKKNLLKVENRHFCRNTIVRIVFRFGDFSALFFFKNMIFKNNSVRATFFFIEENRNSSKLCNCDEFENSQ